MSRREYPERPVVGVGGLIVDAEYRVVLIRRRFEPLAGQWSLPGGLVELGETLERALAREIQEETGLDVVVGPLVDAFDRITADADARIQYHYVLADYLCQIVGGTLRAGSDVSDVAVVSLSELPRYAFTEKATELVTRGLDMARARGA